MDPICRNKFLVWLFIIPVCLMSLYHIILGTNSKEINCDLALDKILAILQNNSPRGVDPQKHIPIASSPEWDTSVVLKHGFRLDGAKIDNIMDATMGEGVKPDDQRLLYNIRKYFLDPPSPHMNKFSYNMVETPVATRVDTILNKKQNGFFVECGANDGERASNTIFLETKRAWKGLLIEMDAAFYLQILGKNRKSHSMNACISIHDYPSKMKFLEDKGGKGKLVSGDKTGSTVRTAYCFPFLSMMLAMNVTHIDYFSLDVEGAELDILKTIPFDKLDISVLSVEWVHGGGEKPYVEFMKTVNYKKHSSISFMDEKIGLFIDDIVFIKESLL